MRAAVPLPPLLLLLAACAGAPPAGEPGSGEALEAPAAPGGAPGLAEDYLKARAALGRLVPPPRPPAALQR